ncbi:hypothetical protein BCR43DRAFT_452077 [Syncephalastrum racemosum]|uniref:Uncharacterized protein n=1 Tax=Syncephalastrum racemosum TaxID=13706 RepID=A0A1X2HLB1_SYNRA|nr:hypothetical protein BCR43DRAFT_452077 [Syncephalastrum racemosum]
MEAIDDWANENIARSVACNVLNYRKQKEYNAIVPLSSKLLCERIRYLLTSDDQWDTVIQWQQDDCPYVIETAWDTPDELYQNQVYYRRLDRETLQCVVEFCHQSKKHYAVVLMLEEEEELKYHNTREFSEAEWKSLTESWSTSLEHAERKFMHHLTHHHQNTDISSSNSNNKKEASANKSDTDPTREAPEDYWGDWSSDEDEQEASLKRTSKKKFDNDTDSEASSSDDDEYYTRWSLDPPGVLTPGPNDHEEDKDEDKDEPENVRLLQPYSAFCDLAASNSNNNPYDLQTTEQQEIQEEYDTSYNPLYTVPSVPDLMDTHRSALTELSQMLHSTLPNPSKSVPAPVIDPLPKIVRSRQQSQDSQQQQNAKPLLTAAAGAAVSAPEGAPQEDHVQDMQRELPGAFPSEKISKEMEQPHSFQREAGRVLLMKSLRALVGVGKLVGFNASDILEMVKTIAVEDAKP